MIIDKTNIRKEDYDLAKSVLNRLRMGKMVFGNPAEGLKKTLAETEKKLNEYESNKEERWITNNKELKSNIAKLKSGIKGEEDLARFMEKEIKENPNLDGLVCFASLSSEDNDEAIEENGYIPDSDFLLVAGNSILVLDAKNLRTSPELPIYISPSNELIQVDKMLLELSPSTYVWRNYFKRLGIEIDSISGATVIINKDGCLIWKNSDWYKSDCKPVYIADLPAFLEDWITKAHSDKEKISLSLLVSIAKTQIRKKGSGMDLSGFQKKFGV